MKQIEKTCKNNIRITFYTGDIDKAIQIHKNICKQLEHAVDEVEEQLQLLRLFGVLGCSHILFELDLL